MVESKPEEFFPKIGRIADKTDALEDREQTEEDDTESRPVEEIESLCMNCQEQVGEIERAPEELLLNGSVG